MYHKPSLVEKWVWMYTVSSSFNKNIPGSKCASSPTQHTPNTRRARSTFRGPKAPVVRAPLELLKVCQCIEPLGSVKEIWTSWPTGGDITVFLNGVPSVLQLTTFLALCLACHYLTLLTYNLQNECEELLSLLKTFLLCTKNTHPFLRYYVCVGKGEATFFFWLVPSLWSCTMKQNKFSERK